MTSMEAANQKAIEQAEATQAAEAQAMDAKIAEAKPAEASAAAPAPPSDGQQLKTELGEARFSAPTEAEARLLRAGDSAGKPPLTESQKQMVSEVNQQVKKDYGAEIGGEPKKLGENNVAFYPKENFNPGDYGSYNPYSKLIEINQDTGGYKETMLHENLHMNSDKGTKLDKYGRQVHQVGIEQQHVDQQNQVVPENRPLNEGITENLTEKSAKNMGITQPTEAYTGEKTVAKALSDQVGEDTIKKCYFSGDTDGLEKAVDGKLGKGAFQEINKRLEPDKNGNQDFRGALYIAQHGMPKV